MKWAGTDIDFGHARLHDIRQRRWRNTYAVVVDSTETSAIYTGEIGETYAFFSVARDNVGNVENARLMGGATTRVTRMSTGGSSSILTGSGSAPLDLSFGLLLFLAWLAGYSNRKVQRLKLEGHRQNLPWPHATP